MATAEAGPAEPDDLPTPPAAAGGPEGGAEAAAPEAEALAPIIVKKIAAGHGGAHGGAWKIALADMMTAMMAFFLLMWILGATNDSQRKSVADYFKPTSQSQITMGALAGSNGILGGRSIIDPDGFPYTAKQTAAMERLTPRSEGGPTENDPSPNSENARDNDAKTQKQSPGQGQGSSDGEGSGAGAGTGTAAADNANFEKLEKEVKAQLADNPNLDQIKDKVQFVRDKEGLRIEVIDKADFSMFPSGTTKLQPQAKALLAEIAKTLAAMPNKVSVRGHTDSVPFARDGRNNWSLSAERAETTRSVLQKSGIKESRFTQIEGVADSAPYNPNDPKDPRNRRVSITIKNQE
jgi:chemotaxis protein MotB